MEVRIVSFLPKSEWQEWAQEWGLTHSPQKGWLSRTENVVGLYQGVLVQVGWGGEKNASLVVRLRYPRTANVEGLRNALIADSSLDTLPGHGAGRKKMTIGAFTPVKVHLWKIPEFTIDDTTLGWFRAPGFGGIRPRQVRGWIESLVAAVRRATPGFDGRCEQCQTGATRQFVLVDEVPMMLCLTCQQRLRSEGEMAERTYEMTEARHLMGFAFAVCAAVAGAVAWAGLAALTERIIAAAAIGIGALVAWAYRRGAGRVDAAGRVVGAVLTIGSVVFGQVLYYAWLVSHMRPDLGFRVEAGWEVYGSSWSRDPGIEALALFFGMVGGWVAMKALQRPKQHKVIREAGTQPSQQDRRAA
jgi:hypothetical protein